MKMQWDDLQTILALVRAGTLAAAGQRLGVSYTTVARRVQRAEAALGRPLFERRPEGYQPTVEADELAQAAARMEAEEHGVMRRLAGQEQALKGPLTLTAPPLLIQCQLAPVLARFTERHPEIDLTVKAANSLLDLSRREADMALRISRTPGETLVGRRLTEQCSGFFAVPDIAEKAAVAPEAALDWVLYSGHDAPPKAAADAHPRIRVRARFDDMTTMIAAAEAGMGALRMPLFLARSAPGLVPLRHLALQPYAPIWLLSHRDLQGSAKVAALKAVLEPWFRHNTSLFSTLG